MKLRDRHLVLMVGYILSIVVLRCTGQMPTVGDFRRDLRSGFGRGIHLAGRVVDEGGVALDGVTVSVTRHEGRIRENNIANGQFELNYPEDLCIYVGFEKEGRYDAGEGGSFMVDEEIPVGPDGRRRIEQTNMVVVLRAIGGPVINGGFSQGLDFHADEQDRGLVLRRSSGGAYRIDVECVGNALVDARSENSVFVLPRLASDGLLSVTNLYNALLEQVEFRAVDPLIEVTGVSNGFVRYEPQNLWPRTDNGVWREMRECPQTGYTNRFALGSFERDDVYVFYRLGGYYGKGRFRVRDVAADRKTLEVDFEGVVQFDGTRNVRTGSNWR